MYEELEPIAQLKYGKVVEEVSQDTQAKLSAAIASFSARGLARSGAIEGEKLNIRLAGCERICRSVYESWLDLITRKSAGRITRDDINFIMNKVENCTQLRAPDIRNSSSAGVSTPTWAASQAEIKMQAIASDIRRQLEIKYREQEAFSASAVPSQEITTSDQVRLDPLLKIPDKGAFNDALPLLCNAASSDEPLSLVLADVDHFKNVNEAYGYLVGDEVLKEVVQALAEVCKNKGRLFRWGGEEFAVLLENYSTEEAEAVAERLRSRVASIQRESEPHTITASFGVSTISGEADPNSLFQSANDAVRTAKQNGRNQVRTAASVMKPRGTTPLTQHSLSVFMRTDETVRKLDETIASSSGKPLQLSDDASFHVIEKAKSLEISTIDEISENVRKLADPIRKMARCFVHTTPVPVGYSVSFALDIMAAKRGLPFLRTYFGSLKLSNFSEAYASEFMETLALIESAG